MKYRQLGQGLTVSAIGLGCMGMLQGGNFKYGADADLEEAVRTIHRAIDLGVTFFDTAEIYGPRANEELVGKAIKGKRDGLVIATKFGFRYNEAGQISGIDSSEANIRRAVEGSLQRLGIDCIDLYYQHRVDPQVPIEDVVGAMAELVQAGKVRYLGVSNYGGWQLMKMLAVADSHGYQRYVSNQIYYSLESRDAEYELVPLSLDHPVGDDELHLLMVEVAVVRLLGGVDHGHRQRVEGLQEDRAEPADEHRGVAVHATDRRVVAEPAGLIGVEQFGMSLWCLGPDDAYPDMRSEPRPDVWSHCLIVPRPREYHPNVPEESADQIANSGAASSWPPMPGRCSSSSRVRPAAMLPSRWSGST